MISSLQHYIAHAYNSIHRISYRLTTTIHEETYTSDGISHWVAKPHNFILWLMEQQQYNNNTMMILSLLMIVFPIIMLILTFFTIMEQVLVLMLLEENVTSNILN